MRKILSFTSNNRNKNLFKSISASFIAKGLSAACTFLFIPLTIDYINTTQFGIWVTLSSIIGWISLLDIGLGNGLKNSLAEALAHNDMTKARVYVSTTYFTLTFILLGLYLLFLGANMFIEWDKILNVPASYRQELRMLAAIVCGSFCIQFVLQLINNIFAASQQYDRVAYAMLGVNLLTLIFVGLLKVFTTGSLIKLGIAVSLSPVIIYLSFSVYYFSRDYKQFIPAFKFHSPGVGRRLFNVGLKFFVIQISLIAIYQLSNLLISHFYSVDHVSTYNIAQKYLSAVIIMLNIIMAPFWSAFTEAYIKGETDWIRKAMRNLKLVSYAGAITIAGMIWLSGYVYPIWLRKPIDIPFQVTLFQGIFFIVNTLAMPYVFFINGTGKILLQTIVAVFGIVAFVPLALLFAQTCGMGVPGIILSSVVCNLPMIILYPIQYRQLLKKNPAKIWQ